MALQVQRLSKIVIVWLAISGWACSQPEDSSITRITIPENYVNEKDERLEPDSLGQLLLDGTVYSGYVVTEYPDGILESKTAYYQGRMEGYSTKYFPNSDTAILRFYRSGEKHGEHLAWYENGQLRFQYFFENGLSVGNHKEWFVNGKLSMDLNYKEGMEFGPQRMYRSDGKLRSNYVVRENGRKYGLVGLKRCAKLDGETGDFDPYKSLE